MTDRIDVHGYERKYERAKQRIAQDQDLLPENREVILRYLRESELGKTIRKGQKRKIGASRNWRVAQMLVRMDKQWLRKPLDAVTSADMEEFILGLEQGRILSERGRPYRSESQMTIKKFIRKFWKWLKGDGRTYPDQVEWIDTSGERAEIRALPKVREDAEAMASLAPDILKKALVMVSFDAGTRESEFLNLRIKDVEPLSDGDETLVVRVRHSKTFGRPISLPVATPYLRKWLVQHPQRDDPEAPLWLRALKGGGAKLISVGFYFSTISRLGKKALGIHVTPHMLRHSSATYYASRLDRATFCRRFGWSFSSKMPDRYIDWAKINEQKTVEVMREDHVSRMSKDNQRLQEELSLLREQFQRVVQEVKERQPYHQVMNELLENPKFRQVLVEEMEKRPGTTAMEVGRH